MPAPTSLGFSFNSFFQWLGDLGPIVQIPIVLIVFGVGGRAHPAADRVRTAAGTRLLLAAARRVLRHPGPRLHAAAAVPGRGHLRARDRASSSAALLFYADYRARQGAGYLFQLVLFSAPATILLLIGLIYPAIATFVQSFFDKTGENFVGLGELRLGLHQPRGLLVDHQHDHLGARSPPRSRRSSASPTRCSSTRRAARRSSRS